MLTVHGSHIAIIDTWVELISLTSMSTLIGFLIVLKQWHRQCCASSSEQQPIRHGYGRGERREGKSTNSNFWKICTNSSLTHSPTMMTTTLQMTWTHTDTLKDIDCKYIYIFFWRRFVLEFHVFLLKTSSHPQVVK